MTNDLRAELDFGEYEEFRFSKSSRKTRIKFLEATRKYEFLYLALVLNKAKLYGPGFQYKSSFYKYAVNLVFQNAKPYLDNAIVVIDRSGEGDFRRQLVRYLKKRINQKGSTPLLKKVKTEPSHSNNLLQLADMVCGAVARSYRLDKLDRSVYRPLIAHRELAVQSWPR